MAVYDRTGSTYSLIRRPDPRIAAVIDQSLDGVGSVANVGAGTGSYEPSQTVVAVEPSRVMINQRSRGAAPVVEAAPECPPIGTDAVDAAMAVLTVHHWTDVATGVSEMLRIARWRVVIFTWDHAFFQEFWLLREYLPTAAESDARLAVPITTLISLLGEDHVSIVSIPVPQDCIDGFGGAYWRRPHAYLDDAVPKGDVSFRVDTQVELDDGLSRLRADLATGDWDRRHADVLRSHTWTLDTDCSLPNSVDGLPGA